MSGEDLAVARHIPQDRRSAQHAYDEVARSLVIIAELRYQDRDEDTGEWLHQWAQELTDGRIGSSSRSATRQRHDEFADLSFMQPEALDDEAFLPFIPDFDPSGLAIEWPISAFSGEMPTDETQPIDYESELLHSGQPPDDKRDFVSGQETNAGQSFEGVSRRDGTRSQADVTTAAAIYGSSATPRPQLSELVVGPREDPLDNAGRQVALVPSHSQPGITNHLHRGAPAVPTEQPTLLALSCFAAGVVCCFVLHTLLLLTPVRLTVSRAEVSPNRTLDHWPAQVTPSGERFEPARAAAFSARPPTPTRDLSPQQDRASSMVEEFYNSNIELFERFARSGD